MNLEGSLDAFGLPDILQLLAFTSKTGALHVRQTGRPGNAPAGGVVHVRDGAIAAASSDVTLEALARRIVAAGLVDDVALRAAVDRVHSDTSVGLVRALLDAGAVTENAVCGLARQQVIDAVCELLRWADGQFSFVVDEPARDALPLTLPVDEVVSEGRRRLGAWRALTAVIPSPAAVLSLSPNPPETPTCTREEWALLSLLDGHRTVGDVVSLLGRAEYAVVNALAALVERGLLVDAAADSGGSGGGLAGLVRQHAMLLEIERLRDIDGETSADAAHRRVGPVGPAAGPLRTVTAPPARTETAPPARTETVPPDLVHTGHDPDTARFAGAAALAGRPGRIQRDVQPEDSVPGVAGSVALDAEAAGRPASDADAQDSVVTKSLLLRLIAGVRGL
jgi:hypothetical protein